MLSTGKGFIQCYLPFVQLDKCYSTFEQPGHGVLIDKLLNASVSTGSCHLVSL